MALTLPPNPLDPLRKIQPPTAAQVPNVGGMAVPGVLQQPVRPVAAPAVRAGTPGPALGGVPAVAKTAAVAPTSPAVAPAGPIVTPAAQAAQDAAAARQAASSSEVDALSGQQYGRFGGATADAGTLESQIRGALGGMFGGQTSQAFINRSRQALGTGVEGQRAQAVKRSDEDMVKRGLFRSGLGAEQAQGINTAAQGAFGKGLADILSQAEQQDIQGRQYATGAATNLLGMNRSADSETQARIDAARARGGGGSGTSTIIDPDTGQSYEVSDEMFQYM